MVYTANIFKIHNLVSNFPNMVQNTIKILKINLIRRRIGEENASFVLRWGV